MHFSCEGLFTDYIFPVFEAQFTHLSSLQTHKITHSNERAVCETRFSKLSNLKIDMIIYTDDISVLFVKKDLHDSVT